MRYVSMFLVPGVLAAVAAVIGCQGGTNRETPSSKAGTTAEKKDAEAEIQAALAKLSAEDRKLAEAQRFCAIENENLLGSMGVPAKIMLQDETVFLCCDGCETRARAHADRTVAKVQQLKERTAADKRDQ